MSVDLHLGDCREVLATMAPDSADSIVTDPPYGLSFMGKGWDHGVPGDEFWREALRVAKPGAFLLAFGGTRTFHRLVCGIEDAGWEIRDQLGWLYGSGFPKSHNLQGDRKGWGTALKPAFEPICMARKPFRGTVAENVEQHGTGALNIDGCRVAHSEECRIMDPSLANILNPSDKCRQAGRRVEVLELKPGGRWPANILHDGSAEVLAVFPETASGSMMAGTIRSNTSGFTGPMPTLTAADTPGDSGSAARFFYCAKASKDDRDEGLGAFALRAAGGMQGRNDGSMGSVTYSRNNHPTVKPHDLMRYLCRLVTPPGGTVLDPFMGSGSTGKAAVREGFRFVGIDLQPEYLAIAEARIRAAAAQGRLDL